MLRHAEASRDGAACAGIYAPFVRDTAVSFEQDPPDALQMAERIEVISTSHAWLVAELEDRVVAFAYASGHRAREAYRWTAEVSVYVDPAHRRRGLGAGLYTALFDLLRRQRFCVACAGITLPNQASVGLHESLGFQSAGVYRAVGWKAGAWWDVGWWQLRLRDAAAGPPAEPTAPQRLAPG